MSSTSSTSPQSSQAGLGDELYSGAASFGLIYALIGAITGTIVGLIMIIGGIYMLFQKISTVSVNAKVLAVNCTPLQNNTQSCNVNVSYNYNGQDQTAFVTSPINYNVGQQITIYVNKDKPTNVFIQKQSPKEIGTILIVIGLFILISGWIWYWLSKKYKFLAAAEGVSGAYNLFRR